jgi:hypothetical protein
LRTVTFEEEKAGLVPIAIHPRDGQSLWCELAAPERLTRANCALAGLLAQHEAAPNGSFRWRITQGVEMGRPSMLEAGAEKRDGITTDGKPAGVWLYAGFLQEAKLISVGYGIEQLLQARTQPQFQGSPPLEPPDADICAAPAVAAKRVKTKADARCMMATHHGRGHHVFPGR